MEVTISKRQNAGVYLNLLFSLPFPINITDADPPPPSPLQKKNLAIYENPSHSRYRRVCNRPMQLHQMPSRWKMLEHFMPLPSWLRRQILRQKARPKGNFEGLSNDPLINCIQNLSVSDVQWIVKLEICASW